ncbi:MAG: phospho-sugar mutase [Oscillospiraceae bacterium]|nr:phospho-sugar mutase [Oscillospiraceae bacterium]
MNVNESYARWADAELEDTDLSAEIAAINGSENEIYERFYTDLVFGTGGLRGILGAGTNRMNIYVVRRATQGICDWLKAGNRKLSAAVSYDSRIKSDLFAKETAAVFAANGIKVYLYKSLAPTPLLSWAIRYYGCGTGVMITASHNPSEYNGYKAYDENGCQLTDGDSADILARVNSLDIFSGAAKTDFDKAVADGMIEYVSEEALEQYYKSILDCRCDKEALKESNLKIAFTPLNGTGNTFVRRILDEIGAKNVYLTECQLEPDGNFPTCPYPNPEMPKALEEGIKTAKENGCDLLIATDPDADRLGVASKNGDDYVLLTGNEVGALMAEYIAEYRTRTGTMPKDPVMVKTVVTTKLADAVAKNYNVEVRDVLTGFKYIGDQIFRLEKQGCENRFIFGFEQSCGYLAGSYIREKDAVASAMLIAEMAANYKRQGKTLYDAVQDLYNKYGYYYTGEDNFTFAGADGMKKMASIMDGLFAAPPAEFNGEKVVCRCDYRAGIRTEGEVNEKIDLPSSDVLSLQLESGNYVIVRPSGTEPKLKVYYMVIGENLEDALEMTAKLKEEARKLLGIA